MRRRHFWSAIGSTPIVAASVASKSDAEGAGAILWHVAQSLGAGFIPLSAEWHVKHPAWPSGDVLKVPFLSQNPSPSDAGGADAYLAWVRESVGSG